MFKNRFEAKMYLKWLLCCDRNNSVSESFESVNGYVPKTSYDVIYNAPLLDWMVEAAKGFETDEWGIYKEDIKYVIYEKLENCIYL